MLPYFGPLFGNAASQHSYGRRAAQAVEDARGMLALLINCTAGEIIWNSGATESNNLAIKGVVKAIGRPHSHVISQATEHKAVLDSLETLRKEGVAVSILDVDASGFLRPEALQNALRPETVLVTLMTANNELGTLTPIEEIGALCKNAGVLFHTDASQAVGKIPLDMQRCHLDLVSVSGHKLYGPKGVGALAFRRSAKVKKLIPIIDGGGHERGMRSGTLNVPAIVGLGRAAEIARLAMSDESERIRGLRDQFEESLLGGLQDVYVNGSASPRLPTITNMAFMGVDAESLLLALDGIAASTGSACTAASLQPSHVLQAIGLAEDRQESSVRFSFGRQTSTGEIREAVAQIASAVRTLRELALGNAI